MRCIPPGFVPLAVAVMAACGTGLAFAQSGDPNLARDLAATCANCHGTNGVSVGEVEPLAGKSKDVDLLPNDILLVPDSTGKKFKARAIDTAISLGSSLITLGLIYK